MVKTSWVLTLPGQRSVVQGAGDSGDVTPGHVGVDHGRFQALVAEKFLHGADIVSVLKEMSGETVSERVHCSRFGDPGQSHSFFESLLQRARVQVVPADGVTARID